MELLKNPYRGQGLPEDVLDGVPWPSIAVDGPAELLARCPAAAETPLARLGGFAAEVWAKDERSRMGLGSFKALGAAYVIAHDAVATRRDDLTTALAGQTYVAASAGNHGLSVAAGARLFGARAAIWLADTVPEAFAEKLRAKGAEVVREGADYEASMAAAASAAADNGWILLSDSSWPGYFDIPHRLMEGYLALAAETTRQMPAPPDLIVLQAGVGGLAAAGAAWFRHVWGEGPRIVVVEPEFAPALRESIRAGRPVTAPGPVSTMGRLDCKEPSLIALKGLARDADAFVTVTEAEAAAVLPGLAAQGMGTTPSGGAGAAALAAMGLDAGMRALCVISEEPEA